MTTRTIRLELRLTPEERAERLRERTKRKRPHIKLGKPTERIVFSVEAVLLWDREAQERATREQLGDLRSVIENRHWLLAEAHKRQATLPAMRVAKRAIVDSVILPQIESEARHSTSVYWSMRLSKEDKRQEVLGTKERDELLRDQSLISCERGGPSEGIGVIANVVMLREHRRKNRAELNEKRRLAKARKEALAALPIESAEDIESREQRLFEEQQARLKEVERARLDSLWRTYSAWRAMARDDDRVRHVFASDWQSGPTRLRDTLSIHGVSRGMPPPVSVTDYPMTWPCLPCVTSEYRPIAPVPSNTRRTKTTDIASRRAFFVSLCEARQSTTGALATVAQDQRDDDSRTANYKADVGGKHGDTISVALASHHVSRASDPATAVMIAENQPVSASDL